ncbi:universal stress protein [Streptomyces sp. PD-S100-1]|uniref:universal stress protein n=1 Tax=Streptomyces sp. PD-S100-1 TaxID=3394351 RepID=UPI0039BC48E9
MTEALVVGVDGSEASLQAVDWAAAEALRHDAPLHLLHAAAGEHAASDVIRTASERAAASAPGALLSSEVVHEDAVTALTGGHGGVLALVVGARGLGDDLPGMLLGSVGLAVAARADCPVVVVRGSAEHLAGRYGCVVVGVGEAEDGDSDSAVRFAFREARARGCRLLAVHAWNPRLAGAPAPEVPPWYAMEAHRRPPAQVLEDALRGPLERYPGQEVSRLVVDGPARRALLEAAAQADLLVVGAHRRTSLPGLQLGLINHALLHHAPCPVAVVPQE